jgi:uncharacterized protein (TIGR01777 family)
VRVGVTGATGTIGRALVRALLGRGDEVTVLSRDPDGARRRLGDVQALAWPDPTAAAPPPEALAGRDAVVHLAGAPVGQRWTDEAKRSIRDSRVLGTRHLVDALRRAEPRPGVLVSGSATGWYGPRGDERLDESVPHAHGDFLAEVVAAWEVEAARAEELGMRVVMARTGVVLSESGGALERMLPPFKLGVGGPIAGGRQYMPWIHLDDEVGALLFCLDTEGARGPVNLTAPEPVTNRDFSSALGRVLRRPALAPVPGVAVRLLFGEMASVVTSGHRVVPKRLCELGYRFKHPELEPALRSALAR